MLILIKVQASDLVMIPSSSPLQAPFPPDHLVKKGKKKCYLFISTIAFVNCFSKPIPEDPVYKLVKECYAFCGAFKEMEYRLYIYNLFETKLYWFHQKEASMISNS